MVKKMNKDSILIKELMNKGWPQKKIANVLNLSKQKVNYWSKHQIKTSVVRKRKLKDIYLNRIISWAKNKPTSSMSCRTIAQKINSILEKRNELDKKGNIISITYKTVNRKVVYLPLKDMKKRF